MALEEIIKIRKQKRQFLNDKGNNPYAPTVKRTHSTQEVLSDFDDLEKKEELISIVGRLFAFREHGAISFGVLGDGSGKNTNCI